jgi:hypothetical protein
VIDWSRQFLNPGADRVGGDRRLCAHATQVTGRHELPVFPCWQMLMSGAHLDGHTRRSAGCRPELQNQTHFHMAMVSRQDRIWVPEDPDTVVCRCRFLSHLWWVVSNLPRGTARPSFTVTGRLLRSECSIQNMEARPAGRYVRYRTVQREQNTRTGASFLQPWELPVNE